MESLIVGIFIFGGIIGLINRIYQYYRRAKNLATGREKCYIATAVYGSYHAPEVLTLRRFRDEVLSNSIFGRLFIRLYYLLSPPLAEKLKTRHRINRIVKTCLDKLVKKLQKGSITI